jgi:tetratricopeptide (TPR) repeat protein
MIVKDEAHVIARCLRSVRPFIDAWVVVDTGSTDGTQEVVRCELEGIPGELFERPWKNFAHNRTEAIELAAGKGDYLLVVDADDVLEAPPDFVMPELTLDLYDLRIEDAGTSYHRPQLFRADRGFHYAGVVHEYLTSAQPHSSGRLEGLIYRRLGGGGRSRDPSRYLRDAALLEQALADDPGDARSAFYLAQSLRDAGELARAADAYRRRAAMAGGWIEEAYVSLLQLGRILEQLAAPEPEIVHAWLSAHERLPRRAEALCELARYHRQRQRYPLGYVFARAAVDIPRPERALFLDESVHDWRALDELAICAYYVGREAEALAGNRELLARARLPRAERARVEKNLALCVAALERR